MGRYHKWADEDIETIKKLVEEGQSAERAVAAISPELTVNSARQAFSYRKIKWGIKLGEGVRKTWLKSRYEQLLAHPDYTDTKANHGAVIKQLQKEHEDRFGMARSIHYILRWTKTQGVNRTNRHGGLTAKHLLTYESWKQMRQRCLLDNNKDYPRYGGRGITVCPEWINDFEAFLSYMGPRPSKNHSIDRIDNDGNYEPGNVRWATWKEQNRNTSSNRILTAFGESMCLTAWAEKLNLLAPTIRQRISKGWPVEEALATPLRGKRRSTLGPPVLGGPELPHPEDD